MYDRDRIQRLKERMIKSKPYKEIVSKGRNLCTKIKLWWKENKTFLLMLTIPIIFFIILIIVCPSARDSLNRNSGALIVVSSIAIAIAASYFSQESVKLEKTKLKPRLTLLRPFLVEPQLIIPIKNIGLGPAYYIHICLYEVNYEVNKEEAKLIKYIEYLPPNQCAEISLPVDLLKKANNKKDVEISQHYQVSYYGPLWDAQSEEKDIGDEWLLEFDKLKTYLENNPRTISDDLEIRI